MKINILRIHNLNSLKGTFTIDFDSKPLSASAIFAITGPTGAGKSTLLDAICVALYGQTPRLSGAESEELMTRHTGECWAEVEFSVKKGRYRSKWSQRRARGRADGRLQPAAMELAALDGEHALLLEEKKSRVPLEVAELTGLDFVRFTRSVLLAQGGFAAFLQAKDNERADLLEKITGTEDYSRISRIVYRKAMEAERRLEGLRAVLDAVELLPDDERDGLAKRRAGALAEIVALRGELDRIAAEIAWFAATEKAREERGAAEREYALAEKEYNGFAPQLRRLDLARRALAIKGMYDVLLERRGRITDLARDIEKLDKRLTALAEEEKRFDAELYQAEEAHDSLQAATAEKERLLVQVERLDEQIAGRQLRLDADRKAQGKLCREREETAAAKEQAGEQHRRLALERKECLEYLDSRREDGLLRRDLPLLVAQLDELAGLREEIGRISEAHRQQSAAEKKAAAAFERIGRSLVDLGLEMEAARREKSAAEEEAARILGGMGSSQLASRIQSMENRLLRLGFLREIGSDLAEAAAKAAEGAELLVRDRAKLVQLSERRDKILTEKKTEEQLVQELEEKDRLERIVAAYEEQRKMLEPQKPCPLCGSLDHPWAAAGERWAEPGREVLDRQRQKVIRLQEEAQASVEAIARLGSDVENNEKNVADWQEKENQLREKWQREAEREGVDFSAENWGRIEELIAETRREEELCRKKSGDIAALEKKSAEQGALLLALGERQQEETERKQALAAERNELAAEIRHLLSRQAEAAERVAALSHKLRQKMPPDLEEQLAGRHFGHIRDELRRRVISFESRQQRAEQLQQELIPLQERIGSLAAVMETQEKRIREGQEGLEQGEKELAASRNERKNLFGEGDTAVAREKLREEEKRFAQNINSLREELTRCGTEWKSLKKQEEGRRLELLELREKTHMAEESFQHRLAEADLTGEQEFAAALLPPDELTRIEAMEKELVRRRTTSSTRLEDSRRKLGELVAAPLTDKMREDVVGEGKRLEELLEEKQGQAASLQQTLLRQDELRREYRERAENVEAAQREARRWQMLNRLIGSADGQKFRRFAQGLTLDHLIGLANGYLADLNDRYVLKRKKGEELGLEVMDSWQADTVRPTSTLSGGEGFLVSLALALGLSSLASRNISIDSLFLDEGFGTLDSDTLETALAALDNLNSGGKTIGLISHVEALKERIPVQIRIHRKGGGVSSLEIAG